MNDRHPSGTAHYAAYDGYSTTSFATDPLFGDLPGDDAHDAGSYDTGQWYAHPGQDQQQYATPYPSSYETGSYDMSAMTGAADTTGAWAQAGYEQQAGHTGQWDTTAYATQTFETSSFETPSFETQTFQTQTFEPQSFETQSFETQTFEAQAFQTQGFEPQAFETQGFEAPVFGTTAYDSGAYDATAWNSGGTAVQEAVAEAVAEPVLHEQIPDQYSPGPDEFTLAHDVPPTHDEPAPESAAAQPAPADPEFTSRAASRSAGRSRRRTPAKRSALLTIAVPSVCVVGVAGIAAASVGVGGDDGTETQAASAPDASAVKPSVANNKLDTQLKDLSADAGDFADRASRTQERIDLKAKQEADRKKAAEEAARKEAMRPKFALPVKQRGLSAYYGQAGINWMSVHTGIDFPVSYGTPVMAATDGTVRTQWNSAYGNMAIVTAKDGTETWYCHLSSHTVTSGPVKAGDVIAHSGNSGNSTGPHLHFEVRPGGGSAIDPLPWLRSHGLDPT